VFSKDISEKYIGKKTIGSKKTDTNVCQLNHHTVNQPCFPQFIFFHGLFFSFFTMSQSLVVAAGRHQLVIGGRGREGRKEGRWYFVRRHRLVAKWLSMDSSTEQRDGDTTIAQADD
jgi:hypothetical protein